MAFGDVVGNIISKGVGTVVGLVGSASSYAGEFLDVVTGTRSAQQILDSRPHYEVKTVYGPPNLKGQQPKTTKTVVQVQPKVTTPTKVTTSRATTPQATSSKSTPTGSFANTVGTVTKNVTNQAGGLLDTVSGWVSGGSEDQGVYKLLVAGLVGLLVVKVVGK